MKCKIEINMDNAAFDDGDGEHTEINWILGELRRTIAAGWVELTTGTLTLKDSNGNNVGVCKVEE